MVSNTTVEKILGKTFADYLDEVVIDAGEKLLYTRRLMIDELGCGNLVAAARLNKVLKRLDIKTPRELYSLDPESLVRCKGVGHATVYVAMCILDANDYSVEKWWGWNETSVKFSTFRHQLIRKARKHKAA